MTKDEALKLARRALWFAHDDGYSNELSQEALAAIREALAQPVQEPVGYWQGQFSKDGGATLYEVPQVSFFGRTYPNIPLYTTPPHRKPLTDEQWQVIADTLDCLITRKQKDAIEAAHGIKE